MGIKNLRSGRLPDTGFILDGHHYRGGIHQQPVQALNARTLRVDSSARAPPALSPVGRG
jgi:hypothetical protein